MSLAVRPVVAEPNSIANLAPPARRRQPDAAVLEKSYLFFGCELALVRNQSQSSIARHTNSAMSITRMRSLFWRAEAISVRLHCWQADRTARAPVR